MSADSCRGYTNTTARPFGAWPYAPTFSLPDSVPTRLHLFDLALAEQRKTRIEAISSISNP